MKYKADSLPVEILKIVQDKATEYPFTGVLTDFEGTGTYLCRLCGLALFRSETKFHSGCGWPSFDQAIPGNVERQRDADARRTEILCHRCHAHLGHVFEGEKLTPLNTRHCVNSLSLDFVYDQTVEDTQEAILAAGCFWGVEYFFKRLPGVLKVEVGYTGGQQAHPSYEAVCKANTGHFEAIRVVYDLKKLTFEKIIKFFFEIHDPTQSNGQGPDLGEQYLSVIFYYDKAQEEIAKGLIKQLEQKNYAIKTKVLPVKAFWLAEDYHQDYYEKTKKLPYCHRYEKKFD